MITMKWFLHLIQNLYNHVDLHFLIIIISLVLYDFTLFLVTEALSIFDCNLVGPVNYIRTYNTYKHILSTQVNKHYKSYFQKRRLGIYKSIKYSSSLIHKYLYLYKYLIFITYTCSKCLLHTSFWERIYPGITQTLVTNNVSNLSVEFDGLLWSI